MSNVLLNAVWPLDMPMPRKFVFVALADFANDAGLCFPSVPALAARCCAGQRTVQEHLAVLEAEGFITRTFSTGRATTYQITDPRAWRAPAPCAPPQQAHHTPAAGAPPPPQQAHHTPAPAAPRTIIEPSIEPPDNRRAGAARSTNRGARLPQDWQPTAELRMWASADHPLIDITAETAKFRDYWAAKAGAGGCKLDWSATWRNWIRTADERRRPTGNHHATDRRSPVESLAERAERKLREGDERERRQSAELF